DKLLKQQRPKYLWIGCSDSRVPANQIVGLLPGDIFVHRNVANLVVHSDLNCLSVIQYAVEVLGISDVIVVGHYGCGGVEAAISGRDFGLIDNWLRHIGDTAQAHNGVLEKLPQAQKLSALCELNVIEQVRNVALTTIVKNVWQKQGSLSIHGWVYGIHDGLLQDLQTTMRGDRPVEAVHKDAISAVAARYGIKTAVA
ncbi:MAG: carbonate dehydratase, partial [Bdellovibrionales bacterium]